VAESPDLNPIENLWHQLVDGIKEFWKTIDVAKCTKYIRHLRKVIPKVIEGCGEPTGY